MNPPFFQAPSLMPVCTTELGVTCTSFITTSRDQRSITLQTNISATILCIILSSGALNQLLSLQSVS
jgi:hypothetical protein